MANEGSASLLVRVGDTASQPYIRKVADYDITTNSDDNILLVLGGLSRTIKMHNNPSAGAKVSIKIEGDAEVNNVIINGNTKDIGVEGNFSPLFVVDNKLTIIDFVFDGIIQKWVVAHHSADL